MADPWESYVRAHVRIQLGGRTCVLRPTPQPAHGQWPLGQQSEAWILTAWNPRSVELPTEVNHERQAELTLLISEASHLSQECLGFDPAGEWAEESCLVVDASRDEVVGWARRFEQNAVFRWTPQAWEVIGVLDERDYVLGWALDESDAAELGATGRDN